ncbi:MAG: hypothetical protein E6124_20365, partial [Blautia producta]|nr:hypothetical protein [Blautia producta]MDU5384524.1 hypothetical protein [Blautia producta]MDU6885387.1 hypothetical protein [Blautia producta]
MIHTSRQLKALVRNQSHGDSTKAQMIIRNYMMERFLERGGCRLILIFKAPTPKQAYPADFLAFQQRTFCG